MTAHLPHERSALGTAYGRLSALLGALGVEIGPDVLDVWRARVREGRDPLPPRVLRELAELCEQLAARPPR